MSKKKEYSSDEIEKQYYADLQKKQIKMQEKIDDLESSEDSRRNKRKLKKIKKDKKWLDKRLPKATKKELKLKAQIDELAPARDTLSKKEQKKLDKLEKKYIRQLQEKKQLTENLQKKKKHKFACCLTSVLLVVVLICGALFGGTFFIYNSYAKDYTGISYFEAVGMIFGLYGADEDKIITNPFNIQEDTDAFFTGLQQSLYLDTKFTIDKLLALIPKEEGGTGDGSQTMATLLAEGTPPEKEEPSGNTSTGNQMLDDLLGDTKFDFSELKDFDGTKKTEFFISDKMIAGILQNVLLHANSIPNVAEAINSLGFDILSEVEIKQTIINLDEQENAHLKLTIQVKVKEIVKELVKQIQEIPPFVKNIISGIVPKNIYLSASISPTQKADPVLSINSIDDNLVQTLLYSLDSKFDGKITNIFNTISETLYNTYMQVQEFAGINGIKFAQTQTAGGISLDALQIVMHAMKVENVTSSDFLLMVKHLHSVDLSGITKEEYLENLDNYSTIESFNSSRDTLLGAYGISDTQSLTPENFIDELPNIVSKVNIKNYKNADGKPLYQCSNEELIEQSRLSDSALAQVFNGFLRNPNGDNSTASAVSLLSKDNEENIALPFDIEVLELTLDGTNINIIASISLENLLKDILPSDSPFTAIKGLIMSIFPKQLYVKIITPYERISEEDSISSNIIFNYSKDEVSAEKSDKMLATLLNIMMAFSPEQAGQLEKTSLCKMIDDIVYEALDQMTNTEQTGGLEISLIEGNVQLPTIYEMLASQINSPEDSEEDKLSAEQLRIALMSYYEYDDKVFEDGKPIDNISSLSLEGNGKFIQRELNDKMFIKKQFAEATLFEELQNLGNSFSEENIDNTMNLEAFKTYNRPTTAKDMAVTSLEFGKLINISKKLDEVGSQLGFYKNLKVANLSTDGQFMTISLCGELNKEYKFEGDGIDKINIENLCADYIIIQATLKFGDETGEHTSLIFNSAKKEDGSLDILLKMINKLSSSNEPITTASLSEKLTKSINEAFKTFKDQDLQLEACADLGDYFGTEFSGKDGFKGANVYKMVASKVGGKDKYSEGDDELLKNVIYNLNNLYIAEGDTTPFVSDVQQAMTTTDTSNCNPKVDLDTSSLPTIVAKVEMSDIFIGKKIKEKVDDDNTGVKMIKFGILAENSANVTTLAERFGIADIAEYNKTNSLFLSMSLSKTLFGVNNSFAGKLLPDNIYATIFVDIKNNSNFSFINNLSKAEMNYLIKLTSTDGSNPIKDKLDSSLSSALNIQLVINDKITITLPQIANMATITPTTEKGGYSNMTISQSYTM